MKKPFYKLFSKAERALTMKDLSALVPPQADLVVAHRTAARFCGGVPAFVPGSFPPCLTGILRCGTV